MADEEMDMSATTQQFQAFARRGEGEPASGGGPSIGLIALIGVLVLVVAAAVVAFLVI